MSYWHAVTKLPLLACVFTTVLLAEDVTGRWKGKADFELGNQTRTLGLYLVLAQDGEKLTGTAGPTAEQQSQIAGAKAEGAKIIFQVAGGKLTFELRMEGNRLVGGVTVDEGGQGSKGAAELTRIVD